jgi:hypothetical protein
MNFDITAGTRRTSVPSNAAPVSAVQHNSDSPSDIADSSEQQQHQHQPKILPTVASASIASSGDPGGSPRSWSGPYNSERGLPIPPICPFPEEYRMKKRNNNNSNNKNDNEHFPIENHNKVNDKGDLFTSAEDNPTYNIADNMTQSHRSLSDASFGSFSMDEEVMYEADGNFRDALTVPVPVAHDTNALPHQKSTTNVPQIVRATNDDNNNNKTIAFRNNQPENSQSDPRPPQQQTLLMEQQGKAPLLGPPPSTTTTNNGSNRRIKQSTEENSKINGRIFDENNEQLKRYETSLLALEQMQNTQKVDETASQTLALKKPVAAETRDVAYIPQPLINNQHQHQQQQQQQQKTSDEEVIELLDDDVVTAVKPSIHPQMAAAFATSGVKRSRPPEINNSHHLSKPIVPGSSLHGYQYAQMLNNYRPAPPLELESVARPDVSSEPHYISLSPTHIPTWDNPLPPVVRQQRQSHSHTNRYKRFELSLLNVSEFTITGLPVTLDGRPSSVLGFRKIVKEVSRAHGKAVFERDNPKQSDDKNDSTNTSSTFGTEQYSSHGENKNPDGGKWRIPLVRVSLCNVCFETMGQL